VEAIGGPDLHSYDSNSRLCEFFFRGMGARSGERGAGREVCDGKWLQLTMVSPGWAAGQRDHRLG
jgi:hypothetical protein